MSTQCKSNSKPTAKQQAKPSVSPPPSVSLWFFTTIGLLMALRPLPTIAVLSICYVLNQEFGISRRVSHVATPLKVTNPKEKKKDEKKKSKKRRLFNFPEYHLAKVKPSQESHKATNAVQTPGKWVTFHRAV